nr:EscR/YscR/HrcR family type III secretion system export apparatus protein [Luteimonas mephitis]
MDFNTLDPALVLLTVVSLALAPFVAVMVTSFTKIVVVLSLLRNALGLQQVPPNVVINGLAIVLSIYVMYPVILDTQAAIEARKNGQPPPVPSLLAKPAPRASTPAATTPPPATSPAAADGEAAALAAAARAGERGPSFANVRDGRDEAPPTPTAAENAAAGEAAALEPLPEKGVARMLGLANAGKEPLRAFLLQHSNNAERAFFLRSAQRLLPPAQRDQITADHFLVVVPAFTVSELTAAFQIGFLIFLPFLVIDMVVANILLALGMMMLSPTTISLPFKLLLFVLIDGWAKLVHGLVLTYGS